MKKEAKTLQLGALRFEPRLHGVYDRGVDVLCVALGWPEDTEGCGTERGLQLDFDCHSGSPVGATVVGYYANEWDNDLADLALRIGSHLSSDPKIVEDVIRNTVRS